MDFNHNLWLHPVCNKTFNRIKLSLSFEGSDYTFMKNDTEQNIFFFRHRLRYKNNNRNSERAAGHEERKHSERERKMFRFKQQRRKERYKEEKVSNVTVKWRIIYIERKTSAVWSTNARHRKHLKVCVLYQRRCRMKMIFRSQIKILIAQTFKHDWGEMCSLNEVR